MTAPITAAGQYASAAPFFGSEPPNLASSADDSMRIRAYEMYEDFYHNRPETFKVFLRGDDDENTKPIYIPSAKKMIEATNRFLAKDFDFAIPQRGTPQEQALLEMHLGNLFKREKIYGKFANQRRYGLIRGDAIWYLTADPTKPQGSRISVHELNPANYFRIEDPDDPFRTLGCHIVDVVEDPRDPTKTVARRLTYLKKGAFLRGGENTGYAMEENAQPGVTYETTFWEIGKWDDRNMTQEDLEQVSVPALEVPLQEFPAQITSLPIYHWKNNEIPGAPFGLSEIAGVETLINGINQAVNDEDLVLVIQGLGFYWTDAKPPLNADGTQGAWEIGPGVVAELPAGGKFERVSGVGSVSPYQDHISMLKNDGMEGLGIPDIAAGKVDVTVAESGVSLALQLLPILAKNEEKEVEMLGTMDHMLHDIVSMWFPAFEGISFGLATAASVVGDAMPVNREAKVQEVILLFTSGVISIAQAQAELNKLGYNFAAGDADKVLLEAHQRAKAGLGELDNRYQQELEAKVRELDENAGQNVSPMMQMQATGMPTGLGANTAVGV